MALQVKEANVDLSDKAVYCPCGKQVASFSRRKLTVRYKSFEMKLNIKTLGDRVEVKCPSCGIEFDIVKERILKQYPDKIAEKMR